MMRTMKRIFVAVVVLTVCLSLYCFGAQRTPWDVVCPGIQDKDTDHLDTRIAKRIRAIVSILEDENRPFAISSVYRSPQKQLCYYRISRVIKKLTGNNGLTTTKRGCHNNMKQGKPSSLAIDLHVPESLPTKEKAAHYLRLRSLARARGLESGGDFRKTNPTWAKHDLGWDPGHVQMKNCKNKIKIQ